MAYTKRPSRWPTKWHGSFGHNWRTADNELTFTLTSDCEAHVHVMAQLIKSARCEPDTGFGLATAAQVTRSARATTHQGPRSRPISTHDRIHGCNHPTEIMRRGCRSRSRTGTEPSRSTSRACLRGGTASTAQPKLAFDLLGNDLATWVLGCDLIVSRVR